MEMIMLLLVPPRVVPVSIDGRRGEQLKACPLGYGVSQGSLLFPFS